MVNLLQIEGCLNFRDLGGYPGTGGKMVQKGRIFRSDCLSRLTERDIQSFNDLGIECVIDLRHIHEVERKPNPFLNKETVDYYHISLFDGVAGQDYINNLPDSLPQMYLDLVDESGRYIAQVFKTIAQNKRKKIVFHCTAGKDRTGVIGALLLTICGVEKKHIIENYAVSYELMKPVFLQDMVQAKQSGRSIRAYLFETKPAYMAMLLDHLEAEYGGGAAYLKRYISEGTLADIRNMLIS